MSSMFVYKQSRIKILADNGNSLSTITSARNCPHCRADNTEDAIFCFNCGEQLKVNTLTKTRFMPYTAPFNLIQPSFDYFKYSIPCKVTNLAITSYTQKPRIKK